MTLLGESAGAVHARLSTYADPYLGQTLAEAKAIEAVSVRDNTAMVELKFGFPCADYAPELQPALQSYLEPVLGGGSLNLKIRAEITAHAVQRTLKPLANVKNIVAVASGKGGVGKSTTAANLALAWAAQGARVGLLDADIYGPSQPLMMGLRGQQPESDDGKRIEPLRGSRRRGDVDRLHGRRRTADGLARTDGRPRRLTQLLSDTHWGELDYLVVDMPPGTGDIQLTLAQRVPVSGADHRDHAAGHRPAGCAQGPQDVREGRSARARHRGEHERTRVQQCGHMEHMFGSGGGARMAQQYGVDCSANCPWTSASAKRPTAGRPPSWPSPQARARAPICRWRVTPRRGSQR